MKYHIDVVIHREGCPEEPLIARSLVGPEVINGFDPYHNTIASVVAQHGKELQKLLDSSGSFDAARKAAQ